MPNIWAHIQYGREILAEVGRAEWLADAEWRKAFQLGCQGPDFLFYHRFLPWQASTAVNRLGTLMHNVRCGPFLLSLFDRIRHREATDPAAAFVLGFLLHHMLDRHLHPFVFSRSGFKKWHHQRYETAMDAVLLRRRAGIDTGRTPVAPEIDTGGRLPGGFTAAFHEAASLHYPALLRDISPAQLDEAVRHMTSAQRLFYDPTGWKGRLLGGQLAPFSPPLREPDWDVLNDARKPWPDPTDRTIRRTESATELWEAALADGRTATEAAFAWLSAAEADGDREPQLRAALAAAIGDVSYETGKPCGAAWITYAEPVL